MRASFFLIISILAIGCGNGVERLDGEGCQPACQTLQIEDSENDVNTFATCLDEELDGTMCSAAGASAVACAAGELSCDTADGLPACVLADGTTARPSCSR